MSELSFYWHDYETFGRDPRRDRPSQFGGVRTDANLNEIGQPLVQYCRPAPDFLPEPQACLLTGILPQTCLQRGVAEHAFAGAIERQLAQPGTVGVGYNSIRFDDEVTRHLFWRNLIDPYAREWQNDCARWDLLDVMRCARALRPEGVEWPAHDDGKASFKLEHLTAANGLTHESAHEALSDVRATIALARLLKARQPRLWDFCLRLRKKEAVREELAQAQRQGSPLLHVSGMYGVDRGCIAFVWPLAPHPVNRNELIVWDLSADPRELVDLGVDEIRERMFTKAQDLRVGVARLPIKTIHLNRSPIVVGKRNVLSAALADRWGIDVAQCMRHAGFALDNAASLADKWPAVFERPARDAAADVDEDLYGGFVGDDDRRTLQRLRSMSGPLLADARPAFADERLGELLFRYRARNFPATLADAEQQRWQMHCARRLHDGEHGALTLTDFLQQVDELQESTDDRGQDLLGALVNYATDIAPPQT